MPRDEKAIVGRKKKQSSGADYVAKKKRVFFIRQTLYISMTKCAIRFIYAADFFYA